MARTQSRKKKSAPAANSTPAPYINVAPRPSPLTSLLSQYELLRILATHLSSADLIHVAETSKTHFAYIKGKDNIYDQMRAETVCDGTGIQARAVYFSHWKSNAKAATVKCMEGNCKPCEGCKANVCNVCRFHLYYSDKQAAYADEENYSAVDHAIGDSALERRLDEAADMVDASPAPPVALQVRKALELGGDYRRRIYCEECNENDLSEDMLRDMMGELDANSGCDCTIATHFTDRWLCIPCFILEEADAYSRMVKRPTWTVEKNVVPNAEFPIIRKPVGEEMLCDCGQMSDWYSLSECRWCTKWVWPEELFP